MLHTRHILRMLLTCWLLCLFVMCVTDCDAETLHTYPGITICGSDILFSSVLWGVNYHGGVIDFNRTSSGNEIKPFSCNASISSLPLWSTPISFSLISDIQGSNVTLCLEPLSDDICVKHRNDKMTSKSNQAELVITGDANTDMSFTMIFNKFQRDLHGVCGSSYFKCTNGRCIDKSLACVPPYNFCGDDTPPCYTPTRSTTIKHNNQVTENTTTNTDSDKGPDIVVIIGILAVIIVPIGIIVFFCYRRTFSNNRSRYNTPDNDIPERARAAINMVSLEPRAETEAEVPAPSAPIAPTDLVDEPLDETENNGSDLPPSYDEVLWNADLYTRNK